MLKSIVLKNFVHFKDKIVIVLNSQEGQTEEQSPNSAENTTPIESKASNGSQKEQTDHQLTNAAKNTTPIISKSLNDSQKEQTEEQSTNAAKYTTPIERNASNYSQKELTKEQSTNAAKSETPVESNASNASQKEQTGEQFPNSAENETPTTHMHSNNLNIFVGANFCGKSTIIELVRRCMTDDINGSITGSYNETKVAYAFCQFDLPQHGEIISGIIKDPKIIKKNVQGFHLQRLHMDPLKIDRQGYHQNPNIFLWRTDR